MSKQNKILLGIATFLPILGIIIAMVIFFQMFLSLESESMAINSSGMPEGFITYFIAIGITGILSLAMTVFYAVHASKNPKVEKDRVIWILLVVLAGTIGHAIYYFLHVLPEPKEGNLPV